MAKTDGKCLCMACRDEEEHARGLGENCYRAALRKVNAGETTWEELEELGLARAPYATPRTKFDAVYEKAKRRKPAVVK